MKYIIENHEDLHKLVQWYCHEQISADEYWAAIDVWAGIQVTQMILEEGRRRRGRRIHR
jgi:hypothetical protein